MHNAYITCLFLCDRPVLLTLLLYSYWVPQIVWNAMSGSRRCFTIKHIIGVTLCKLIPALYFLILPYNILYPLHGNQYSWHHFFDISSFAGKALIAWSAFQVTILLLQRKHGARFFLHPFSPDPSVYNYYRVYKPSKFISTSSPHVSFSSLVLPRLRSVCDSDCCHRLQDCLLRRKPPLTTYSRQEQLQLLHDYENDPEQQQSHVSPLARNPIDTASSSSSSSSSSSNSSGGGDDAANSHECAVCFTSIDLRPGEYMVTPCDHLFHPSCLQQWMEIKLECPICRAALPDFVQ